MKTLHAPLFAGLAVAGCLTAVSTTAQDTTEDLIKRLRGQAGAEAPAGGPKIRTRGLNVRSAGAAAPEVKTETRSLYFSTRGIPKSVQVAAEEDKVSLTKTTAKASAGAGDYSVAAGEEAYEVKYSVDPESMVSKDNIFFKKGSDEFVDESSFRVVVQLADALKHSSLAELKYVIEGHASAEGSAHNNQVLSQKRAERIVTVLAGLGVSPSRLLPIGFGETQARFPANSGESLLKQDRRVLIFRLDR